MKETRLGKIQNLISIRFLDTALAYSNLGETFSLFVSSCLGMFIRRNSWYIASAKLGSTASPPSAEANSFATDSRMIFGCSFGMNLGYKKERFLPWNSVLINCLISPTTISLSKEISNVLSLSEPFSFSPIKAATSFARDFSVCW